MVIFFHRDKPGGSSKVSSMSATAKPTEPNPEMPARQAGVQGTGNRLAIRVFALLFLLTLFAGLLNYFMTRMKQ
jgi:hypothetical protein